MLSADWLRGSARILSFLSHGSYRSYRAPWRLRGLSEAAQARERMNAQARTIELACSRAPLCERPRPRIITSCYWSDRHPGTYRTGR